MGSRMMLDEMAAAATRALLEDAAARGWQASQAGKGRQGHWLMPIRRRWSPGAARRGVVPAPLVDADSCANMSAQATKRKATNRMFPSIYPHHHLDPQPVPRALWEDLGLTPEQGTQLGPLLDAPAITVRPSRVAAVRHVLGAGLVRVGRFIQGCADPGPARPEHDPLGTAP